MKPNYNVQTPSTTSFNNGRSSQINDKKRHIPNGNNSVLGNLHEVKKPRNNPESIQSYNFVNTEPSNSKDNQHFSVLNALKKKAPTKTHNITAEALKNYSKLQNEKTSRNTNEIYTTNEYSNAEFVLDQDPGLPIIDAISSFQSIVPLNSSFVNRNDNPIFSNDNILNSSMEGESSITSKQNNQEKDIDPNECTNETFINSTVFPLSEFIESDFIKQITSEDFFSKNIEMYKDFTTNFEPIVKNMKDKASSSKKEDRDNLAMQMWKLGYLENNIRNTSDKVSAAKDKIISLLCSLDERQFVLNKIIKTIQKGKNEIYHAAKND
uniref:ECM11 domain-containing protein n=1 Tax=Parastrongyloides trichosuri TaxID=131310 RepID=A0A0N4ZN36_PARTI